MPYFYVPCRIALRISDKSHLPSSLSEVPADEHRQMAEFGTSPCLTDWGRRVKGGTWGLSLPEPLEAPACEDGPY